MRYLVIIQANPAVADLFDTMNPDEVARANQGYFDIMNALEDSGELVDSKAVHDTDQRTVRVTTEGPVTVEVPRTETRVSGYYLIDVADETRAIEIAALFPEAQVADGVRIARVYTAEDFAALGL